MSKRILSLVLALVMVLGTFGTVFAAETAAVTVEKDAATFLAETKILLGDDKGNLNLDLKLERRDMVILLSRLLGDSEVASKFPVTKDSPSWTDVRTDDYYVPFYAWAQVNKFFNGNTDKELAPRAAMTAQDYSVVLLRVLGYEADGHDAWKAALADVKELGILENVVVEDATVITRGQMSVMTYNALGVLVKNSTKTLAETLGIKMPEAPEATELTAKVNDTENLKEIVVELSNAKLADTEKLEESNNYKLTGNVVETATLVGDDVVLLLKDALVKNREYELVVRNIDKDVNGKFKFKANDNTIPEVEKVEVLGEYGIKVTTTEPINDARERNFLIDGKNVAMNIEQYGRDIILTPYYKTSLSEKAEKLTIKELVDFAGYKSVEKDFAIEVVKDTVAPKVVDVISKGNKVEVIFDKDVYDNSVAAYYNRSNVGNISHEAGRQTIYATDAEKIDTNKVLYTFKDELTRRTNVTIVDVENHSEVKMEKTTVEARVVLDYSEPEIIEKKVTPDYKAKTAKITLYFDKDVKGSFVKDSETEFVAKDHFTLYEREVYKRNEVEAKIDSVKYDGDRRDVIVVELVDLTVYNTTNDLDYILEVINFTDATSLKNKMYRDYVDFKVSSTSEFVVTDVSERNGRNYDTEITIKFSKSVDRNIAENLENYILVNNNGTRYDVKTLKGDIVAEKDGKEVTIILPDSTFKVGSAKSEFGTLRIIDILKDKDGNRLAKEYTHTFGEVFKGIVDKAIEAETDAIALLLGVAETDMTANQKALEKALNELVALQVSGKYTKSNHTDLVKAIEKVEKAIEKVEKDNKDNATSGVSAARVALRTKIKEAEALLKVVASGTEKTDLQTAVNNSKLVVDASAATEGQLVASEEPLVIAIDDAQALVDVATATAAVVKAEGSKLQADVTAAQKLVTALPEGTVKVNLKGKLDIVQSGIDKTAGEAAVVAVKVELQEDITAAQAKHDVAVEGTIVGQYADGSKATFKTVIDAANIAHNLAEATVVTLNQAKANLATAVAIFDAAVIAE